MPSLLTPHYAQAFVSRFPGDRSGNRKPRQTPGVLWSRAEPTPVAAPTLIGWSEALATELGIDKPTEQREIDILGGNRLAEGMYPYAACYAGHQFGGWAGQLGDGRAITLGEWQAADERVWELQLKGAGPTAYSRRADGRAVLRSSVREYLMSEAMHHLGVPTTRALSLVGTGDKVLRDMFYNGNAAYEPGAIVCRVAPSLLRFGNWEMLAARGEVKLLRELTDWVMRKFFPEITGDDAVIQWFAEIVRRTAALMVEWQRVGFVHGVMNTDNMSILGLTIDYGPYSFLDDYDPMFTPNTTDLPGRRYAFGGQPAVAKWNLGCLAGALVSLAPEEELIKVLDGYDDLYWNGWYSMMGRKLGFAELAEEDKPFLHRWDKALAAAKPDMTLFYQRLATLPNGASGPEIIRHFEEVFYEPTTVAAERGDESIFELLDEYVQRLPAIEAVSLNRQQIMQSVNPRFVLRNYLLHEAIQKLETGDHTMFNELERASLDPYGNTGKAFEGKRPDWAKQQAGCSMLSCSS